jgi:hypothetical protein
MAILMQVRPFGLSPVSGWDQDQQRQYPIGSLVHVNFLKGRSPKMHRFYFALIDFIGQAIGYAKEVLSDELLMRTGRIDSLSFINGETHAQPKRISKMRHADFKSYVDDAVELICAEYVPAMTRSKLLLEIERLLGITYDEAFKAPTKSKKTISADSFNDKEASDL